MPDIIRRTLDERERAAQGAPPVPAPAASAAMSQADFFRGGPRMMTPEQAAKFAALIRAQAQRGQ